MKLELRYYQQPTVTLENDLYAAVTEIAIANGIDIADTIGGLLRIAVQTYRDAPKHGKQQMLATMAVHVETVQ